MYQPKNKIGFVCTGKCDSCPVHTWRSLIAIHNDPDFSLKGCSRALVTSFNIAAISKDVYDKYLEYQHNYFETNEEDDETYKCQQIRTNSIVYSTCSVCAVHDYLIFLGFKPTKIVGKEYLYFTHPETKEIMSCKDWMYKLVGVLVNKVKSYPELYQYRNRIDPVFIEQTTNDIIARAKHLEEVNELQHKQRLMHEKEVQRQIKEAEEAAKESTRIANEEKFKTLDANVRSGITKRKNYYATQVERLKAIATKEASKKTTINEYTNTGFGNWRPPVTYTGDGVELAKIARENKKLDEYFNVKLRRCKFEHNSPEYIAYRTDLAVHEQCEFLNRMRYTLYNIYHAKYYESILDAPVCCRDCVNCEIQSIYRKHYFCPMINEDNCRDHAVIYTDEIADYFGYFLLDEMVDSPNHGNLKFYDTKEEIIKKIKIYLGNKFINDPDSAKKYFNLALYLD